MKYLSTKVIDLGSCAFRQWRASSHCKYIHGYRLQAKFWFACNELDSNNWVVDFGGLKDLKTILEKQFDHTLCIAGDDPLIEGFKSLHAAGGCDLRIMPDGVGIERTAEWCLVKANEFIKSSTENRCWVEKVEVWEHDKNSAITLNIQNNTTTNHNNMFKPSETVTPPVHVPPGAQVRDFLEQVQEETGVNVAAVLKNVPIGGQNQPKPAPVGNKVTTGFSNLFGGTSWGI